MSYYSIWKDVLDQEIDDTTLLAGFFRNIDSVKKITENGSKDDLEALLSFAKKIELNRLLSKMEAFPIEREIVAADVPCFSTFENGAYRINELLETVPEGLSFREIGYQLAKSGKTDARIKYGENHAMLAEIMGTVSISRTKLYLVKNTALGSFLASQPENEKDCILKMMLLQNCFIRHFVDCLNKPAPSYRNIVSCLSDSTAYRRRTSVRCLMEYLLSETMYESKVASMDWQV